MQGRYRPFIKVYYRFSALLDSIKLKPRTYSSIIPNNEMSLSKYLKEFDITYEEQQFNDKNVKYRGILFHIVNAH